MKGSSNLDPCLTPADLVGEQLKVLVVGDGNKMDGFLNKGEISQAAQLAMSVLKAVKAKSPCGNELGILVKIVVGSKTFPHLVLRSGLSSSYLITLLSKNFC